MAGELPAAHVTGGDVSELGRLRRRWFKCLLAQVVVARAGASRWGRGCSSPPHNGRGKALAVQGKCGLAWLGKVTMDQHETMQQSQALGNAQSQPLD